MPWTHPHKGGEVMSDVVEDKRTMTPEQAKAASIAAFEHRHHYRITITISGRVRFLSHLETVDTLLGALRRSGVKLALSPGMRPKPRIKMAMPRPVATEAWADIVEVELAEHVDADQFALQLSEVLPAGLLLQRLEEIEGAYASAASRVAGATWRWNFGPDIAASDLDDALGKLLAADEVLMERSSPGKRTRSVDVRRFIGEATVVTTGQHPVLRAFVRLTDEGSTKPEEVIRALGMLAGRPFVPQRTVRESIAIAEPGQGGRVAEPELVGADVPDGPAKPWGAC
jgi:radical SAM-linked protein